MPVIQTSQPDLAVREAGIGDVEAIAAVHVDAWRVAYRGQIPDAYLAALGKSERARAWLQWLGDPSKAILVGCRGGLLEGAIDIASRREFQELTLWVLESNAPARTFYEALGFRADGRTKTDARPAFSLFEMRYSRPLGPLRS